MTCSAKPPRPTEPTGQARLLTHRVDRITDHVTPTINSLRPIGLNNTRHSPLRINSLRMMIANDSDTHGLKRPLPLFIFELDTNRVTRPNLYRFCQRIFDTGELACQIPNLLVDVRRRQSNALPTLFGNAGP